MSYMLKFKEELLHNIVIRGVKDIKKVNLRKISKNLNYNYETQTLKNMKLMFWIQLELIY